MKYITYLLTLLALSGVFILARVGSGEPALSTTYKDSLFKFRTHRPSVVRSIADYIKKDCSEYNDISEYNIEDLCGDLHTAIHRCGKSVRQSSIYNTEHDRYALPAGVVTEVVYKTLDDFYVGCTSPGVKRSVIGLLDHLNTHSLHDLLTGVDMGTGILLLKEDR